MVTRRARLGLLSPDDMACKRFDARGDIAICMGLPDSSLRGFSTACAGRAADGSEDVARLRRDTRCTKALGIIRPEAGRLDWFCRRMLGAKKSRYSGREVAATAALLNARVGCWALRKVFGVPLLSKVILAARRHDVHVFDVAAIASAV